MTERLEKKAQFQEPSKKRGPFIAVISVALVAVLALAAWAVLGGKNGSYPPVTAQGGVVTIPAAQVSDGKAHFFSYRDGATTINFFVLKSSDGIIRAAFDACDVCYRDREGYRQDGDFMICNACEQRFASDKINEVKGGCNPAPLNRVVLDGQVVINVADLQTGAWYFAAAR
jgi:uncharacterized membrane protein